MELNMMKFKPLRARLRASFAAGQTEEARIRGVDRANGVLRDVQIVLEGEAKGHGVWLDRAFCEAVAAAGNAMGEAGVKVRFGHPAMCADAIGTYLGRATNFAVASFRRAGTGEEVAGVVADIAVDKFADRAEWVLNMAESAPDTFGQSIVFTYGDFKVKDADGAEHSYQAECVDGVEDPDSKTGRKTVKTPAEWRAQSADGRVYAVLGKLHGTDFTDTPAATDGVFSDTSLAAEAERMLDEHPEVLAAVEAHPEKVYEFCARIGILDRIESKRVANLQAEKDREIAALRADLDAARAEVARTRHFETDCAEKASALGEAMKALEQLAAKHGATERALAEAQAALAVERKRYREQVGAALHIAKEAGKEPYGRARALAALAGR